MHVNTPVSSAKGLEVETLKHAINPKPGMPLLLKLYYPGASALLIVGVEVELTTTIL